MYDTADRRRWGLGSHIPCSHTATSVLAVLAIVRHVLHLGRVVPPVDLDLHCLWRVVVVTRPAGQHLGLQASCSLPLIPTVRLQRAEGSQKTGLSRGLQPGACRNRLHHLVVVGREALQALHVS